MIGRPASGPRGWRWPSGWRPRPPSRWTLRTRLLVALISLLAATSVVIGLVSVLALGSFLQGRLDDQLTFAVGRSRVAVQRPPDEEAPLLVHRPERHPGPGFLLAPGQSQGTLGAQLSGGKVTSAAVLDSTGTPVRLTTGQLAALNRLSIGARPRTVQLGGSLGDYRVVVARAPDGNAFVTGLPLSGVRATVYRLAAVITAVTLIGLALAALAGAAIVRLSLRPLRRVADAAGRVSELQLDRGEVALGVRVPEADTDPRTEVGQVGAALNRMIGHVAAALAARHASEERVRRFVADASHELRTPLAAIRGYAELTRRGQDQLPPDAAHAMQRVESQAIRMGALVEDLLLLARLDEGRPVERAPVDLSVLLVDAVGDAHAAGPDHDWRLHLPQEPVEVIGDVQRLHQVVANLLANARAHTPAGTQVTASVRAEGQQAVLTVTDDGPGIPAQLLPEVFGRFVRGDSSRSREAKGPGEAGSTGLGLAIVQAVVAAHHGTVSAASEPGRTCFTVRLPRATPAVVHPPRTPPSASSHLAGERG